MTPPFHTIYSEHETMMLRDAHEAITTCDLWEWLREFNPHPNEGFMFSTHPNLTRLAGAMTYKGHSGSSYAWTMRVMKHLATTDWHFHATMARRQRALEDLEKWARTVRVSHTRG